mgnify:CR=1 FL=1
MKFFVASALLIFIAVPSVATAADPPREVLETLVGTWEVEGTASEMELVGEMSAKWGDEKSCVVSSYSFKLGDEKHRAHHLTGLDRSTNSINSLGFFSHGVMDELNYKKASEGVYKGSYGIVFEGEKYKGDLTVTVTKNSFKFETMNVKGPAGTRSDLSVTLKRVKE